MKRIKTFIVALIAAVALLTPVAAVAHDQQQPPKTADTEYEPVTGEEQEQLPAAPLVIGAYAVVWLAVIVYLWSIWRRLSQVEREIAQVARRIEAGGRR